MSSISTINRHTISVRALVDFCLTEGDLVSQQRPSPSAFEGQSTHSAVQKKRTGLYKSEVALSLTWVTEHFELIVSGRADGVFENGVEEIKTTRIPIQEIAKTIKYQHQLQAKVYAAMLCLENACDQMTVKLTYAHPQTLQEWSEETLYTREHLLDCLTALCARYDAWLTRLEAHWQHRKKLLEHLSFPYKEMRPSQRQMAETVYKACRTNCHATIEAPTGTGKSLAALFPALKAFTDANNRALYFLTMKTTGKHAAQEALIQLDPEQSLTVVFLSSKAQLCLNSDSICDGEYCPYAQKYFLKRTAVRQALLENQHWHSDALLALGRKHQICPYYLSQDWAIWSDIVVGDMNYIYDTTAVQPYLLKEINNKATILIDEGHNLIDRGRMIFSSEFNGELLQALLKQTPKGIQRSLRKIQSKLRENCKNKNGTLTHSAPTTLLQTLRDFLAHSPQLLRDYPGYIPDRQWQEFIFLCARFTRINELANQQDFVWRYHHASPAKRGIELLCLNPATLLASKHNLVNNVITFSATFKPWQYTNYLNGLPQAVVQTLPSPFSSVQYDVFIASDVSTRYQHRQQLPAKLMPALSQVTQSTKNSMVFFSSYAQLRSCCHSFQASEKVIIQSSDWRKEHRDELLNRFHKEQGLTLMTVLGGAFAEGIDLPGNALEQVVVIGPGLPQVNDINNAIKQRMNELHWPGFEFAYVFPGLQKVLQAAGRCVRTEQDHGQILLIDDRFEQYHRNGWLPDFWSINSGTLSTWKSI